MLLLHTQRVNFERKMCSLLKIECCLSKAKKGGRKTADFNFTAAHTKEKAGWEDFLQKNLKYTAKFHQMNMKKKKHQRNPMLGYKLSC